jgi:hypothetical protein
MAYQPKMFAYVGTEKKILKVLEAYGELSKIVTSKYRTIPGWIIFLVGLLINLLTSVSSWVLYGQSAARNTYILSGLALVIMIESLVRLGASRNPIVNPAMEKRMMADKTAIWWVYLLLAYPVTVITFGSLREELLPLRLVPATWLGFGGGTLSILAVICLDYVRRAKSLAPELPELQWVSSVIQELSRLHGGKPKIQMKMNPFSPVFSSAMVPVEQSRPGYRFEAMQEAMLSLTFTFAEGQHFSFHCVETVISKIKKYKSKYKGSKRVTRATFEFAAIRAADFEIIAERYGNVAKNLKFKLVDSSGKQVDCTTSKPTVKCAKETVTTRFTIKSRDENWGHDAIFVDPKTIAYAASKLAQELNASVAK